MRAEGLSPLSFFSLSRPLSFLVLVLTLSSSSSKDVISRARARFSFTLRCSSASFAARALEASFFRRCSSSFEGALSASWKKKLPRCDSFEAAAGGRAELEGFSDKDLLFLRLTITSSSSLSSSLSLSISTFGFCPFCFFIPSFRGPRISSLYSSSLSSSLTPFPTASSSFSSPFMSVRS